MQHPEFDGDCDALKLFAATYPQVWSVYGTTDYAVNTLPEVNDDLVIPVSFVSPESTDYNLCFTEINGLAGQVLFLEDLLLGEIHEIEENKPILFNYNSSQNSDRFLLHFSHPMGLEDNTATPVSIYAYNNSVYINLTGDPTADVIIYDMLGREVLRRNSTGSKLLRLDLVNVTGYFMVTVQTKDHLFNQKVFVR
jgi:hypothetical protein